MIEFLFHYRLLSAPPPRIRGESLTCPFRVSWFLSLLHHLCRCIMGKVGLLPRRLQNSNLISNGHMMSWFITMVIKLCLQLGALTAWSKISLAIIQVLQLLVSKWFCGLSKANKVWLYIFIIWSALKKKTKKKPKLVQNLVILLPQWASFSPFPSIPA